jgi:hypothetical protein
MYHYFIQERAKSTRPRRRFWFIVAPKWCAGMRAGRPIPAFRGFVRLARFLLLWS